MTLSELGRYITRTNLENLKALKTEETVSDYVLSLLGFTTGGQIDLAQSIIDRIDTLTKANKRQLKDQLEKPGVAAVLCSNIISHLPMALKEADHVKRNTIFHQMSNAERQELALGLVDWRSSYSYRK